MSAIETNNLEKRFGGTIAVSGVNLDVPRGDVYGFLGPNGSGKTTTIRILVGLIESTSGTARIHGETVGREIKTRQDIGYAPASPPLYEYLTGREHLEYTARFRNVAPESSEIRIQELLEKFDLEDAANDKVESYSTGMKQKLNIMQAGLHDPSLLILDEPTSGLDPQAVSELKEFILGCSARNKTVFLSTHILSIVDDVADTIGILNDGRLSYQGPESELSEDDLESAFLKLTSKNHARDTNY